MTRSLIFSYLQFLNVFCIFCSLHCKQTIHTYQVFLESKTAHVCKVRYSLTAGCNNTLIFTYEGKNLFIIIDFLSLHACFLMLNFRKDCYICFNESIFKTMKDAFLSS